MTALVAVLSPTQAAWRDDTARRALDAMASRGVEVFASASSAHGTVAIAADEWEQRTSGDHALALARDGATLVVADAAMYYRADLARALAARGEHPSGPTGAHLILAAYRVWGVDCAQHLEGDFAFIVWDGDARRLVAARDFAATRPLFYAAVGDTFILASTISGVLAAGADDALDLSHLGEVAAGLALDDVTTCRRAVQRVPAGHTLLRAGGAAPVLSRHWSPPRFETGRGLSLEDGALALRDLLVESVRERLDPSGATSVWLSGGWDSPAVFGAGMIATDGAADRLRPVSISYAEGDPGREDELIESIAARWNAGPHWIDSKAIALLDDIRGHAAAREEPFAHAFEHWNRALAKGTRAVDARVALEGNGGDQLFQVSLVYLADLARRGRWGALARECRARGVHDARTLFRWAVQPLLPAPALRVAAALRGNRPLRGYLDRPLPPWIDPGFARRHNLHERARAGLARQPDESHAAVESRWYFTSPYFPRVFSCVSGLARAEGVERRSPLLDGRVIAFAAERPREERAWQMETKRALRAAMRGILPDESLAPRRARTGTTGTLFARALRQVGSELIIDATRRSRLADLGIVNPGALRRAWYAWESGRDGNLGVMLFLTLQAEFWMRAHERWSAIREQAHTSFAGRTYAAVTS
jgi:asparagine synthase (glutamine-hydrolysing)